MKNIAAAVRRRRPHVVLGFLGCMAQSRGQQLLDELPQVDLVVGTQKFHRTADYLDEIARRQTRENRRSRGGVRQRSRHQGAFACRPRHAPRRPVSSFVSIMQGCNQYCTFCIVPYTRGEERSRSIADIAAECRKLAAAVSKKSRCWARLSPATARREIPPRDGKSGFVQLLEAVQEIDGLERIRFTSPHPKGYGDDLVEAYKRLPKLCQSAHLPVQSGSDRVLKAMHRGYTRARYLSLVEKLRQARPSIGLTTDIIVGFPGETEEDFGETLSLAREVQFDNAYVFKYSTRKDTPAAQLPEQVPAELKEERHARLLETINAIGQRRYDAYAGRTMQILVEGPSQNQPRAALRPDPLQQNRGL